MVTLTSALIAATVAIAVVVLREWLTRSQEEKRQQADRLADFSASAWVATLAIGRIALAATTEKQKLADDLDVDAAGFNRAVAVVRLLDSEPVYRAALDVDGCLNRLLEDARASEWQLSQWKDHRRDKLAPALAAFELKSRQDIGARPVTHISWTSTAGYDGS
jgi:hypothetical protein